MERAAFVGDQMATDAASLAFAPAPGNAFPHVGGAENIEKETPDNAAKKDRPDS